MIKQSQTELFLMDLVRCHTLNPRGEFPEDYLFEKPMTDYLIAFAEKHKLKYSVQEVSENRSNLFIHIQGKRPEKILFIAHQDTVPVDNCPQMLIPEIDEEKLYGRGSVDTKASSAVYLTLLKEITSQDFIPEYSLCFAFSVDEEYGFTGMKAIAEYIDSWNIHFAFVAEPTSLEMVTTHRGTLRFHIEVKGLKAHSAMPAEGDNAITKAMQINHIVQAFHNLYFQDHPKLGEMIHSLTQIHGGETVNIIPDKCCLTYDLRTFPGMDFDQYFSELTNRLDKSVKGDYLIKLILQHGGIDTNADHQAIQYMLAKLTEIDYPATTAVAHYTTDATFLFEKEIPTVVFGPGSIAQAHSDNEYITRKQLQLAENVYRKFIWSYGKHCK